ncbi:MAG TPA: amino acid adenylation domain-containing protein [Kofleriaceae bacterium]|nr:amino acid adenylation domain-containing protein [Kofleriaceae bacterium]
MTVRRRPLLELTGAQRAELDARLAGAQLAPARDAPALAVEPAPGAAAPLSFAQERLWFLDRLEPDSVAYCMTDAKRLTGPLRVEALRAAFDHLVARHDILRTRYVARGGEPAQIVDPSGPAAFTYVDLRDLAAPARARRASELVADEVARRFDLARGPVFRALLVATADDEHALLVNIHHIASDGWSHGILFAELGQIYGDLVAGRAPSLPPLALRYAEFAAGQRRWLAARSAELIEPWRAALHGMGSLDLPLDRARPARPRFTGGYATAALAEPDVERIRRFAGEAGATPFMVLLTAWAAVLARISGQGDFGIGVPVAGRTRSELEPIVGFFVNTLVMRVDAAGDPSFRDLVARLREVAMAAFANQDVPFEAVVAALAPRRDPGTNPLFQVAFVHNVSSSRPLFAGISDRRIELAHQGSQFDLTLLAHEDDGHGIGLMLGYDDALFDAATAAAILTRFVGLLTAALAAPGTPLGCLPLASDADPVPAGFGVGGPELAAGDTVLGEIASQVAARPDAIAVVCAGERVSYGALDRRANRLAHALRRLGLAREAVVVSLVPRSVDAVVAILACWKAGVAHLWLDPEFPPARLRDMAGHGRAAAVIAPPAGFARAGIGAPHVDPGGELVRGLPETAPDGVPPHRGDELAYVIYTSGSTGTPKGVAGTHRGLHQLAAAQRAFTALGPGDRMLVFASFSFDVSLAEVAVGLGAGATLYLTSGETALPGRTLAVWIDDEQLTYTNLTPSVLAALPAGAYRSLRTVISAGEALPAETLARWAPGRRVFNLYGPAEATSSTAGAMVPDGRRPGIGTAHPGWRIYVLDALLRPVPVGVAGELYVGGANLARGYLGQPGLTAQRFVPDPWSPAPGARMYRSGDQARWRADGTIELLGRIDRQLKLRGIRIEPGEIEAALRAHPAVADAAVALVRAASGDPEIAAYIVARDPAPAAAELRDHLRARLPSYLVPGSIVLTERIPVTSSGKLDRGALAGLAGRPLAVDRTPPASELEHRIAGIWQSILGVGAVGRDDNFFEVGGNSLSLVRLQAGLCELAGRELSLVELFRHPTVRAQAAALGAPSAEAPAASAGPSRSARGPSVVAIEPIAVVGAAIRLPGASDLDQLWDNLCRGVESTRRFTRDEALASGVPAALVDDPCYVPVRGAIDGVEDFDPRFFGLTRRSAELMDPQQRVLLECVWEALERSGHDPQAGHRVGLFAGSASNVYAARHILPNLELMRRHGRIEIEALNASDYVATRSAYTFDLRGPAMTVQTACSTGLVAVHLAARSLQLGECDVALAGGVSLEFPRGVGYLYHEGEIDAPDGHCRAFDAAASGTIPGEGAGVVVLRRLSDALADGDHVLAVMLGSALNNDGVHKMGFTAPSIAGQVEAIRAALDAARVDPSSIGYVEAHGTGTPLGDPIELAALDQVFAGLPRGAIALGSIKSNFGHTGQAAGIAGFLKAVLVVQRGALPPTLHVRQPHPALAPDRSAFRLCRELAPFVAPGPRRAGVSSFGIGGTNAHAIVEQPPPIAADPTRRPVHLLTWSARTVGAADRQARDLAGYLASAPDSATAADVAATLARRRSFEHRRALVCRDLASARAGLAARDRVRSGTSTGPRTVAFAFPGSGTQRSGMGAALYEREPVYREVLDRCADAARGELGSDLRELMFDPARGELLARSQYAQPAVFATSYALAELLRQSHGVVPAIVFGHSLGELAAACVAGLWPVEAMMRLAVARGRAMEQSAPGGMLAVRTAPEQLAGVLSDGVAIAAVNGPRTCVVSGPLAAIAVAERDLARLGIEARRLHVSRAFHSELLDPVLPAIGHAVAAMPAAAPLAVPWISSVTGERLTREVAGAPSYWMREAREPVQFARVLDEALRDPGAVIVEVGPAGLGAIIRAAAGASRYVATLDAGAELAEDEQVAEAVGALWLAGVDVARTAPYRGERRVRLPLPTYPFERERHWIEPPRPTGEPPALRVAAPSAPEPAPAAPAERPAEAGALEATIVALWQELLGSSALGPHDNVFAHGVSSLNAAQMGARLAEILPVRIPIRRIMDATTPAELAAEIESILIDALEQIPEEADE